MTISQGPDSFLDRGAPRTSRGQRILEAVVVSDSNDDFEKILTVIRRGGIGVNRDGWGGDPSRKRGQFAREVRDPTSLGLMRVVGFQS